MIHLAVYSFKKIFQNYNQLLLTKKKSHSTKNSVEKSEIISGGNSHVGDKNTSLKTTTNIIFNFGNIFGIILLAFLIFLLFPFRCEEPNTIDTLPLFVHLSDANGNNQVNIEGKLRIIFNGYTEEVDINKATIKFENIPIALRGMRATFELDAEKWKLSKGTERFHHYGKPIKLVIENHDPEVAPSGSTDSLVHSLPVKPVVDKKEKTKEKPTVLAISSRTELSPYTAKALFKKDTFPLAFIDDFHKKDKSHKAIRSFDGCVYTLTLQNNEEYSVRVDLKIKLNKYDELSEPYEKDQELGFEKTDVAYFRVGQSTGNYYPVEFYVIDGTRSAPEDAVLILEKGERKSLAVRINVTEKGIYNFDCITEIANLESAGVASQQAVLENLTWVFDTK